MLTLLTIAHWKRHKRSFTCLPHADYSTGDASHSLGTGESLQLSLLLLAFLTEPISSSNPASRTLEPKTTYTAASSTSANNSTYFHRYSGPANS